MTLHIPESHATMDEPSINPYAAPQSVAEPFRRKSPAAARMAWVTVVFVFTLIRGFGMGFTTMILLVHWSGTQIHWHNAVPILLVILALCLFAHWVESRLGTWRGPLTYLALATYGVGVVVTMFFGFIGSFPTPF